MSHWESKGKSNDWYTPAFVFEALGERFDLDVAGKQCVANSVPADRTLTEFGIEIPWDGFVWMNPPFGGRNGVQVWLDKFFQHRNGIALTADRTSAPWFQDVWRSADIVLFTPKIKFLREDGTPGDSPSNGTALWASGAVACAALHRAARGGLGIIGLPLRGAA